MDSPRKPDLTFWQILNMSVGFFGIQHGFEIQFARMSAIYEKLGAKPEHLPLLWLAAPATGLLIQPIIGYLSDNTWIPALNMRRRPYFLLGALLSTAALFAMPSASSLWVAAGLLWVLDASLNISMEPFRAFVADKQNSDQRPTGFAMQSLMIGMGTIVGNFIASVDLAKSSAFRTVLGRWPVSSFPVAWDSAHLAFYCCAIIFLASVLYTVFTSSEYPPEDVQDPSAGRRKKTLGQSIKDWARETADCYLNMPPVMRRLAVIQFFTWMGLFCMWMYYAVAVAHNVFGAVDPHSELYDAGIRWAARTSMVKGIATPLFALCIPTVVRRIGRAHTHALALLLCGFGLFSLPWIRDPKLLYLPMIAAGIGWASIVSMPYVILVEDLPKERYGIFMGVFNMFIVLPEILVSLGLGGAMSSFLHDDHALVVAFGGALILVASALTLGLRRFELRELKPAQRYPLETRPESAVI